MQSLAQPACLQLPAISLPCLQMVGKALKGLPRDQVVVATKMGRYGPDLFDFSAERVRAGVRESLERLQLSYIDILHAHDIEFRNIDQVGLGPVFGQQTTLRGHDLVSSRPSKHMRLGNPAVRCS